MNLQLVYQYILVCEKMKICFKKKTKQKDKKTKTKKNSYGDSWTPDLWRVRSMQYLMRHDN